MSRTCSSILAALLATSACAQTTDDKTGSLTGIVKDSITHLPVKKAMVMVNPAMMIMKGPAGSGRTQAEPKSTVTDATGTFTVANLPAGQYRVVVQHQNYPQARFGGVTKSVEVKPGETGAPISVDLIPGAAVSGRVVDEEGEPIQGCFVQAHSAKNPEQGVSSQGNPSSNPDGDYRFYSVPPGKYILTARCMGQVFQARPFSSGPDPPPSRGYPVQYDPLATDAKAAEAVELMPGSEKTGIDFKMRPGPVTQVHGVLSPAGAEWNGRNLNLQLMSVDPARRNGMNAGGGVDQAKGTFEFRQVFPGSYMLLAFSNDGGDNNRIGVAKRIEVNDRPLDIVLELQHAFDLSGKVEFDGNSNQNTNAAPGAAGSGVTGVIGSVPGGLPISGRAAIPFPESGGNSGQPSFAQLGIQLFPAYQVGMPFPQVQVGDDGSFTLKGVIPGTWRILVNGPLAFVKSAWVGSTEVTNAPIDLSNGAAGPLRIVVSTNTATLRGSAPAGQTINAQRIDEDLPFRSSRGTQVDQTGQYVLSGLTPGKYRLVLMDSGGPVPDEGGQEVTVKEGETVMFDLKPPSA